MRIQFTVAVMFLAALPGCSRKAADDIPSVAKPTSESTSPVSTSAQIQERRRALEKQLIDLRVGLTEAEAELKSANERVELGNAKLGSAHNEARDFQKNGKVFSAESAKERAAMISNGLELSRTLAHLSEGRVKSKRIQIAETEKALIDLR